jgi:hypothetical protein
LAWEIEMRRTALALLACLATAPALAEERSPVDVALLLAVDVSGSVSEESWRLQRDGIAQAVASDEFARAVRMGSTGRIAIAVVQWGSDAKLAIGWRMIEGPVEAKAVAGEIRTMARTESGATCMGNALMKAVAELASWEDVATRRVVDISGDGADNCNLDLATARAAALEAGLTLNGLPIVTPTEPQIVEWYERKVIGGPGAFVVVADGHARFAEAFLKKLTLEIADARPYTLAGDFFHR